MLHLLPLEPLEERYTAQWADWFPREFRRLDVGFNVYNGEALTDKVEVGEVLDAFSTNHWKMTQIANLIRVWRDGGVRDGDIIFTTDMWHPGLEALAYIRDMTGTDVRIGGILHAGTWCEHDFTVRNGMRAWARGVEQTWYDMVDVVIVGSEWHAQLIREALVYPRTVGDSTKIHVTGLPFYADEVTAAGTRGDAFQDNPIVVWPHRFDPERQPEVFWKLKGEWDYPSDICQFIPSKMVTGTKSEFYRLLNDSKVALSTTLAETWGYSMLEAAAAGCWVVVPDDFSYVDLFPRENRYSDLDEARAMIEGALRRDRMTWQEAREHYTLARHEQAIERMIDVLAF